MTLILTRQDVRALLDMDACIAAVERAFAAHAAGDVMPPGILAAHVEQGGFHVKTAGLRPAEVQRSMFAAKVNANFPGNPDRHGLPTIQGVVALFDASDGRLLALLDSMEITRLRTAAATAVAAKYLARPEATTVVVCGAGEQGRSQLHALSRVRPLGKALVFDSDRVRAERYAEEMSRLLALDVTPVAAIGTATKHADIWVTCTPSERWFVGREHVMPGAFVAAVGADNPGKQEIEPELLAASRVVVDLLEQCATIGDLHHALDAGVMDRGDVHAELGQVVQGLRPGRERPEEVIVFDSTGTALQDVAAAALVYDRAMAANAGLAIEMGA